MSDKTKTGMLREAALYMKGTDVKVPLKGVQIDVAVKDVASHSAVTQVFENTQPNALEAVYCFPIEEGAAVNGFEIETGGRSIKGIVEEREKAFETYDTAIEAGDASYLLDREAGDILLISVGNIKPGQEVKTKVTYVAELPVSDGIVRLQIPTTVSPRYAPQNSDPVEVDRIAPPYESDVPYRLGLTVRVLSSFVTGLSSPSHMIKMTKEGEYTVVTLEEEAARLDRDFILEIAGERRLEPICILASNDGGDRAALLRFFPELDKIAPDKESNSEVIFILDCSGSMSGSSIKEAKNALELSLRSLSENDLFNIIRFGSTYEFFSVGPVTYNSVTLNEALKYLRRINADLGGTELAPALSRVCSLPKRDGSIRDVLLLTDGEVSNPQEIIAMISNARDRMRVFTFGIGFGASPALVKGAARAGRGACEMIQPGEKIQQKVLRQFSRMCRPSLTDVSVTFNGMTAELPPVLPPLFEGDSFTLFARVLGAEPDAEVVFTGNCLGRTHSWKAKVGEEVRDDSIPCLWAMTRVRELQENDPNDPFTVGSNQVDRRSKRIEKEVTDLGLRFSLLTSFTSFVAVEERKGDEKSRGRPEFHRIPVQLTKDWHGCDTHRDYLLAGEQMGRLCQGYGSIQGKRVLKLFGPSRKFGVNDTSCLSAGIAQYLGMGTDESEWYLELLGTQQAEGFFSGLQIVADRLKLKPGDLEKLADTLDMPDKAAGRKILITLLAVHLLSTDPDARAASGRARSKANRWLQKQVSPLAAGGAISPSTDFSSVITVNGEPLREYMKNRYNITV
jgi:Ca-activated chloride channel homolog